ncbi:hypothetical protein, partial [Bradyrhizobium sp. 147]|uniref:hypothetical protein n=1 Tax=Bradyrhizobium sp. 147 TaxID=2782623 RepID=UPI001FF7A973
GLVAALAGLECAIRHEQSVHRPTKMPEFLPSLVGQNRGIMSSSKNARGMDRLVSCADQERTGVERSHGWE